MSRFESLQKKIDLLENVVRGGGYGELTGLRSLPVEELNNVSSSISAVFSNGESVDHYIELVKKNESSGNIEYHLSLIERILQELKALNNPLLENFIQNESQKLEVRKRASEEAIGNKVRGADDIYR